MNDWSRRLPDGVNLNRRSQSGFELGVSLPVDATGMWPMKCPVDREHLFKMVVTQDVEKDRADDVFCPYCGHEATVLAFAREQTERLRQAARAAAEQYVHHEVSDMLRESFGGSSSGFLRVEIQPGTPPRRRSLPLYEIEETRRSMGCDRCGEVFAVYGLAIYCPSCGQLAPAQQFREIIRAHRERLDSLHSLSPATLRDLHENGTLALSYESTLKDGFGALETYLKRRFSDEVVGPLKTARGVFQRLDEAHTLYQEHLGIDLAQQAGTECWSSLKRAAAIRHLLVHNAGVVDQQFLGREPDWDQALGQRITVSQDEAVAFLDAIEHLASSTQAVSSHPSST